MPTNDTVSPWKPMSSPTDLKCLGKLIEELGEATSAASRCLIQGIDETEPITGKSNRLWLEEELADVLAGIYVTVGRFQLRDDFISKRALEKKGKLLAWHKM